MHERWPMLNVHFLRSTIPPSPQRSLTLTLHQTHCFLPLASVMHPFLDLQQPTLINCIAICTKHTPLPPPHRRRYYATSQPLPSASASLTPSPPPASHTTVKQAITFPCPSHASAKLTNKPSFHGAAPSQLYPTEHTFLFLIFFVLQSE